jgi:hypothetical protein
VVVKKRDAKRATAKPVKDADIQVPIVTRKPDAMHQSNVEFGMLRECIAYTLGKNYIYGAPARANAEANAEDIARSIMYEDRGFRIRFHEDNPRVCNDCKAKGEE